MAFDLSSLRRGKSVEPPRVVVYGEHGVGKSTFAASAPAPVFICTEDGIGNVDTTSFPLCSSYQDVLDAIGTLYSESHNFETVVLDSLDWLEKLVWKQVALNHEKTNIEQLGYGKGYVFAADLFREILAGLNALRLEKNMAVVLTAHSQVKRHDSPISEPFDRFAIKLHKDAAGVVLEWADVVGFAAEPVVIRSVQVGSEKKVRRGVGRGERMLHVVPSPAYAAKNRFDITQDIPLDWSALVAAMTPNTND
jgi:hypothetical protein